MNQWPRCAVSIDENCVATTTIAGVATNTVYPSLEQARTASLAQFTALAARLHRPLSVECTDPESGTWTLICHLDGSITEPEEGLRALLRRSAR